MPSSMPVKHVTPPECMCFNVVVRPTRRSLLQTSAHCGAGTCSTGTPASHATWQRWTARRRTPAPATPARCCQTSTASSSQTARESLDPIKTASRDGFHTHVPPIRCSRYAVIQLAAPKPQKYHKMSVPFRGRLCCAALVPSLCAGAPTRSPSQRPGAAGRDGGTH